MALRKRVVIFFGKAQAFFEEGLDSSVLPPFKKGEATLPKGINQRFLRIAAGLEMILTKEYSQGYTQDAARLLPPRAKRSLGQNFLQDANIARKIVDAASIGPEDSVLEIGPGPGALTRFLLKAGPRRLLLAEKDAFWAAERQREAGGHAQIILCDALQMAWERFSAPWKFIGNLPYNVASPLMWELFSRASGLERAVFMVQKEVGLRLAAGPGSGAYGALGVWAQSFVRPRIEFLVPPQVFRPRPKVDSAVLSFTPLGKKRASFDPSALALTVKRCFQMRRKQLGVIVKSAGFAPSDLEALGLDPRARPETLTPEQFHTLAAAGFFSGKH